MKVKELHNCQFRNLENLVKALKYKFISNTALSRRQNHPNYKLLDSYFQVDGKSMRSEGNHLNLPKDDFRVKYFKTFDLITAFIENRFNQPSFIAFFLI